jgi:hypothetical protein
MILAVTRRGRLDREARGGRPGESTTRLITPLYSLIADRG